MSAETYESYQYISYLNMRIRLKQLARDFPDLLRASTAESELDIKHRVDCFDPNKRED